MKTENKSGFSLFKSVITKLAFFVSKNNSDLSDWLDAYTDNWFYGKKVVSCC